MMNEIAFQTILILLSLSGELKGGTCENIPYFKKRPALDLTPQEEFVCKHAVGESYTKRYPHWLF